MQPRGHSLRVLSGNFQMIALRHMGAHSFSAGFEGEIRHAVLHRSLSPWPCSCDFRRVQTAFRTSSVLMSSSYYIAHSIPNDMMEVVQQGG